MNLEERIRKLSCAIIEEDLGRIEEHLRQFAEAISAKASEGPESRTDKCPCFPAKCDRKDCWNYRNRKPPELKECGHGCNQFIVNEDCKKHCPPDAKECRCGCPRTLDGPCCQCVCHKPTDELPKATHQFMGVSRVVDPTLKPGEWYIVKAPK